MHLFIISVLSRWLSPLRKGSEARMKDRMGEWRGLILMLPLRPTPGFELRGLSVKSGVCP